MSLELINRSNDLKQLRDEGYEVKVSNVYLLINHVPYVNSKKEIVYGTLVSRLELAGDCTKKPSDHVALWVGDYPCNSKGLQLTNLVNNTIQEKISDDLVATYSFSQKPEGGYKDYYEKMTQYVKMLESEARVLDPNVKTKTFSPIKLTEDESVFCYLDSASSRAGITTINAKLKKGRIAIIGLGGTGAYLLDLVAKTPVEEIHLFDGDSFLQHNAFRSPGAPSFDDLVEMPTKVAWFTKIYSRMRRKIIPHPSFVDETNINELKPMNFVFLCLDKGIPKWVIVDYLIKNNIPFIDVGMGLNNNGEGLTGLVRVTTCTPSFHEHVKRRIPFSDGEDNEYSHNIQIADLNALNAALAVIKWKRISGFYINLQDEHNTSYQLTTNNIVNDEEIVNETKDDHTQVC